jgi:hypothetical protein
MNTYLISRDPGGTNLLPSPKRECNNLCNHDSRFHLFVNKTRTAQNHYYFKFKMGRGTYFNHKSLMLCCHSPGNDNMTILNTRDGESYVICA